MAGKDVTPKKSDAPKPKRGKDALHQNEARCQTILQASTDVFCRKAFLAFPESIAIASMEDGKFIEVNDNFLKKTGFSKEEVIGHTSTELALWINENDRQRFIDELTRNGSLRDLPFQYRMRSGEIRDFLLCSEIIQLEGKLYSLDFITDITHRKQAERILKKSEEKFAKVFRSCPLSITIANIADGRYIDVNDVFLQIAELRKEETIGRTSNELKIWLDPDDRRRFVDTLTSQGFLRDFPLVWRSPSGKMHHFLTYSEIIDLEGQPCTLNFIRDVTELKQAEEEKLHLQAQLLQSQKLESVGRLAGGVAHDFNNMLNVIQGYAELAQSKLGSSDPIHADLQEIISAAERSARVTRQLLAFARKQMIAPKVLNLNATINGMYEMLHRIIGEQIQIDWHPAQNLWPVRMDPSQMDQMVANLCINARDAIHGPGKITITTGNSSFDSEYCKTHPGYQPGFHAWLAVRDNGCGMSKETLAHIFEPFFTTKGVGEGTGLGLAMIYGAVKQNNGFITTESEPGRGSCFTIYLPRFDGEPGYDKPVTSQPQVAGGKETILLVEDEPAVLVLTQKMLEKEGYTVLVANVPRDALQLADQHADTIHLLLTDVIMPEMDGSELAKCIFAHHPRLKVLYMSGYSADAIANLGVLEEGVHFLQKPFAKKDMLAKVREVLDQR